MDVHKRRFHFADALLVSQASDGELIQNSPSVIAPAWPSASYLFFFTSATHANSAGFAVLPGVGYKHRVGVSVGSADGELYSYQ